MVSGFSLFVGIPAFVLSDRGRSGTRPLKASGPLVLGRDPRCYSESGLKLEIPVKKSGTGAESDRFENDEKARDETRSRAGAFRALRHRNYRLYFIGQLTSLAGTWMQSAAQA